MRFNPFGMFNRRERQEQRMINQLPEQQRIGAHGGLSSAFGQSLAVGIRGAVGGRPVTGWKSLKIIRRTDAR